MIQIETLLQNWNAVLCMPACVLASPYNSLPVWLCITVCLCACV